MFIALLNHLFRVSPVGPYSMYIIFYEFTFPYNSRSVLSILTLFFSTVYSLISNKILRNIVNYFFGKWYVICKSLFNCIFHLVYSVIILIIFMNKYIRCYSVTDWQLCKFRLLASIKTLLRCCCSTSCCYCCCCCCSRLVIFFFPSFFPLPLLLCSEL